MAFRDMRKFGAIGYVTSIELFIRKKKLGPDALEIGGQEFAFRIGKHDSAIKTVLLDQKVVAGIGNLYADEVLYQSRIHPMRSAMELSAKEVETIFKNTRKVLLASIRVSSNFERLPKGFMLSVRGPGASCPRGNGKMASLKVNGRTTFYCPSCQTI
jgi:formamidopyrimidine-DNA glycosylase